MGLIYWMILKVSYKPDPGYVPGEKYEFPI